MFVNNSDPITTSPSLCIISSFKVHEDDIYGMIVINYPNEDKRILTCSYDGSIVSLSLKRGEIVETIKGGFRIFSLVHWNEFERILTTDSGGFMVIWKYLPKITLVKRFHIIENTKISISGLKQVSKNTFITLSTLDPYVAETRDTIMWKVSIEDGGGEEVKISKLFPSNLFKRSFEVECLVNECVYQLILNKNTIFFGSRDTENSENVIFKFDWKNETVIDTFLHLEAKSIALLSSFLKDFGTEYLVLSCISSTNSCILFTIFDTEGNIIHHLQKLDFCYSLLFRWNDFLFFSGLRTVVMREEDNIEYGIINSIDLNSEEYQFSNYGSFHDGQISFIKFLDDKEGLVVTSSNDGKVKIIELMEEPQIIQKFEVEKEIHVHDDAVNYFEIVHSHDSTILISASDDGTIVVYNLEKGKIEHCEDCVSSFLGLIYVKERKTIVCTNYSGQMCFYGFDYSEEEKSHFLIKCGDIEIGTIEEVYVSLLSRKRVNPNGNGEIYEFITCCQSGFSEEACVKTVTTSDFLSYSCETIIRMNQGIFDICFSLLSDDTLYFTGGSRTDDKKIGIRKYSFSKNDVVKTILEETSVCFISLYSILNYKHDELLFCSSVYSKCIFQFINEEFCRKIEVIFESVSCFEYFDNSNLLCGGGLRMEDSSLTRDRGSLQLLNVETGNMRHLTHRKDECVSKIRCIKYDKVNGYMIASTFLGMMKVFRVRTLEEIINQNDVKDRVLFLCQTDCGIDDEKITVKLKLFLSQIVVFRSIFGIEFKKIDLCSQNEDTTDKMIDEGIQKIDIDFPVLGGGIRRKRSSDDVIDETEHPKKRRKTKSKN